MRVYPSIEAASGGPLRGAALCLGNFDGVHLGHRTLFAAAARLGSPWALTFQPQPGRVLQPSLAPKLITTHERKLELLASAGLAGTIVQPFTPDFAATPPRAFEALLFQALGVAAVVVGHDFSYGARRAGNTDALRAAAAAAGARAEILAPACVDGVVISSSRIREYVLEGRVEAAARLLGRPFALEGTVVRGAGRGRQLGFATANLAPSGELLPAPGVYAVRAFDGRTWRGGATNVGAKPTFGDTAHSVETHLFGVDEELYGRTLRVELLERLRPVRSFASPEELAAQIASDLERAAAIVERAGAAPADIPVEQPAPRGS